MDINEKVFLEVIGNSVKRTHIREAEYEKADWKEILRLAIKNGLMPILYEEIKNLSQEYDIDPELVQYWRMQTLLLSSEEIKKNMMLANLLSRAEEENILMILFKGCVIADLYKQYELRCSSDSDILVYERDKQKAIDLLVSLGYYKDEKSSKEQVYNFISQEGMHKIELHFCLWEDFKGAKMDILNKMKLDDENSLIKLHVSELDVTTLGYNEHLAFQMFHLIKHFSVQGVSIRYLTDIALYINRYEDKIDKELFWNRMRSLGYEEFSEILFSICINNFGMSDEIMSGRKISKNEEVENILRDFIIAGVLFDRKAGDYQILGIMTPYFVGEQDMSGSKFTRVLKAAFPSRKALPDCYGYAKKVAILLPVAWVHKWMNFIMYKISNKGSALNASEKIEAADYRISLLNDAGLLKSTRKGRQR